MVFEVSELLKFYTEKIIGTDMSLREKPSLGSLLENETVTNCAPRSEKKVDLRLGGEDKVLFLNLAVV